MQEIRSLELSPTPVKNHRSQRHLGRSIGWQWIIKNEFLGEKCHYFVCSEAEAAASDSHRKKVKPWKMDDFRSKSYGHGRMQSQIEPYSCSATTTASSSSSSSTGVRDMRDLRCYSASYASSVFAHPTQTQMGNGDVNFKFKKGRSTNSSSSKSWGLADPELQRKKRVASYKVYAVEGKLKGSMRKSFKWLKDKYTRVVYGL